MQNGVRRWSWVSLNITITPILLKYKITTTVGRESAWCNGMENLLDSDIVESKFKF